MNFLINLKEKKKDFFKKENFFIFFGNFFVLNGCLKLEIKFVLNK